MRLPQPEILYNLYLQSLHAELDDFDRSQNTLKAEIAGLRARVATLDEILIENSKLRAGWLAQLANYGYGHNVKQDDHVHKSVYQNLSAKYQEAVSSLYQANQLGEKYRKETKVLHERRQRDKQAIKTWQEYHDRLMSKKCNAHHDLNGLIVAIESPPLFHVERQEVSGHLSHGMPDMTSPSGIAADTGDHLMVSTSAALAVPSRQQAEQSDEVLAMMRGEQARALKPVGELAELMENRADEDDDEGAASRHLCNDLTPDITKSPYLDPVDGSRIMALPSSNPQQSIRGPVIRSSQSTDGEDAVSISNSPVQKDHSPAVQSGEPEVISIRSTKRKRMNSRAHSKKSTGEAIPIKSEVGSSPMHDSAVNHLNETESVDLDEVTAAFTTPRKRLKMSRRSLQLSPRGDEYGPQRHQSLPPAIERHQSAGSRRGSDQSDSPPDSRLSQGHVQPCLHRSPNQPRATNHDGDEAQHEQSNTALRRLDVNRPLTPRFERSKDASTKHRRGSRGVVIQDFAEDGQQYSLHYSGQVMPRKETTSPSAVKCLKPKRLNTLLEISSSPNRKVLTPASKSGTRNERPDTTSSKRTKPPDPSSGSTAHPRKENLEEPIEGATRPVHHQGIVQAPKLKNPLSAGRARLREFDMLETLISPTKAATAASCSATPPALRSARVPPTKRPSAADKASPATPQIGKLKIASTRLRPISSHEKSAKSNSIRTKAISELKSHDFRINTEANFGQDHAFTDVVRNQDARLCLPGCTKSECCGEHFRKMVELGGLKPASRGIFDPTSSQEGSDDRLLREYMGYNAGVIPSLSEQKREDLLSKARTEQLSKQVGRHRAQWERAKSPPGFWNTDFPTTQEAVGYRSEASKREMAEVLERRREAMRSGGKWKFADE